MKKVLLLVLPAVLLTACSSEPSEAEIKTAMERMMDKAQTFQKAMNPNASSEMPKITHLKKIKCESIVEKEKYKCAIAVQFTHQNGKTEESEEEIPLVKKENKWSVENALF